MFPPCFGFRVLGFRVYLEEREQEADGMPVDGRTRRLAERQEAGLCTADGVVTVLNPC